MHFPSRVNTVHLLSILSENAWANWVLFHPHSPLAVDSSDVSNKNAQDDPSPSSTLFKDHFVVTNDSSVCRFRFDARHNLNDPS